MTSPYNRRPPFIVYILGLVIAAGGLLLIGPDDVTEKVGVFMLMFGMVCVSVHEALKP